MSFSIAAHVERWPIAGGFTISRGTKTEAVVVVAEITDGRHAGRGECVPYARYGETVEGVMDAIRTARIETPDREALLPYYRELVEEFFPGPLRW